MYSIVKPFILSLFLSPSLKVWVVLLIIYITDGKRNSTFSQLRGREREREKDDDDDRNEFVDEFFVV